MGNAYSFHKIISKPISQIAEKKAPNPLRALLSRNSYLNHLMYKYFPYSKDKHEMHNKLKSSTK